MPGQRQQFLDNLARKSVMLAKTRLNLEFFDGSMGGRGLAPTCHPAHLQIRDVLVERLRFTVEIDWDNDQARFGALLNSDASKFGDKDFEVLVRAMRKGDMGLGGFAAGYVAEWPAPGFDGNYAYRSGWIARLLRNWDRQPNRDQVSVWDTLDR
jgi:hypothetical protein